MWYGCETGAPGLDCKRPYGNSDVEGDVCEILCWPNEAEKTGEDTVNPKEKRHREFTSRLRKLYR